MSTGAVLVGEVLVDDVLVDDVLVDEVVGVDLTGVVEVLGAVDCAGLVAAEYPATDVVETCDWLVVVWLKEVD